MFRTTNYYRMPAEWEKHEATWLAWPWCPETFPPEKLPNVQEIYLQMIEALVTGEKVHLLVNDVLTEDEVRKRLRAKNVHEKNVFIHQIRTEDVWIRDYGPIFVVSSALQKHGLITSDAKRPRNGVVMIHWIFNAWGNKWPPLDQDTHIPVEIEKITGIPRVEAHMVLEGGSIDVNGKGTLMTSEQCLLNKNRNPKLTKDSIEAKLSEFLGIRHFIWLGEGIIGDDTDGHVDDIARFIAHDTVIAAREKNPNDPNHAPLEENWLRLQNATDQDGKKLTVLEFPMPGEIPGPFMRAPASYTNFYIGNSVVLAPIYHHDNDQRALELLKSAFPTRKVVGIFCQDLVYGFGAIHCVTQQKPYLS